MSTSVPDTEIAIHRTGAQRMGFFTDTSRVHRVQGLRGRVQAVERPARGRLAVR